MGGGTSEGSGVGVGTVGTAAAGAGTVGVEVDMGAGLEVQQPLLNRRLTRPRPLQLLKGLLPHRPLSRQLQL
jgi:hypothetical protein